MSSRPTGAPGGTVRPRVAIVVLDGTFVLDLAVAVQAFGRRPWIFRKIRDEDQPPYDVVLCGRPSTRTGTIGLAFGELHPIEEIATADTVIATGLDDPLADHDPDMLAAIAAAARRGARMISLCAGAFVLGRAGVLDGHRVTTHWALAGEFRAAFPAVQLVDEALYVDDGQVLSSGGMLAAADLCLHVLRSDLGQSYANDVARLLVSPPHRSGGQSQYTKAAPRRMTGSLAPVMEWALAHLDEPLTLEDLARRAHLSTRTVVRQFRTETGSSPMEWVAQRRIERARELLEDTDMSVTQIAYGTGFGSAESFRRHFLVGTGTSPRAYRETFRVRSAPPAATPAPTPTAASWATMA